MARTNEPVVQQARTAQVDPKQRVASPRRPVSSASDSLTRLASEINNSVPVQALTSLSQMANSGHTPVQEACFIPQEPVQRRPSHLSLNHLAQTASLINTSPLVQTQKQLSAWMNSTAPTANDPAKNASVQRVPAPAQLRKIPDPETLFNAVKENLDAGENDVGSKAGLLSSKQHNVDTVSHSYTPGDGGERKQQKLILEGYADEKSEDYTHKESVEEWYDQIDARVRQGAQETMGDALHWAGSLGQRKNKNFVPESITLLGAELHDRGLGPARVEFKAKEFFGETIAAIIKPEDRNIEKALLGKKNSIASELNAKISPKRQISTLHMDVDPAHGTIVEDITSDLMGWLSSKVNLKESEEVITGETIAFAFLNGIYDLHKKNVLTRGAAPVLIDADVALRPQEFEQGPSKQEAFGQPETGQIKTQLAGGKQSSEILKYAMENPDEVIESIMKRVGDYKARIVPVFTPAWQLSLMVWLEHRAKGKNNKAMGEVLDMVGKLVEGADGSKGLQGELGENRGEWNIERVASEIEFDYKKGQVPYFQYQPSTGEVFYHGYVIWQGQNLKESMVVLKQRLTGGGEEK